MKRSTTFSNASAFCAWIVIRKIARRVDRSRHLSTTIVDAFVQLTFVFIVVVNASFAKRKWITIFVVDAFDGRRRNCCRLWCVSNALSGSRAMSDFLAVDAYRSFVGRLASASAVVANVDCALIIVIAQRIVVHQQAFAAQAHVSTKSVRRIRRRRRR